MNCRNCGTQIVPGEMFCRNCGTSVNVNNQPVGGVSPMGGQPVVNPNVQPMMQPNVNPVQPVATSSQPVGNPTMPTQQPKKSNKGVIVLVAVIVVAVVVIGAVFLMTNNKKDTPKESNSNSSSNVVESNSNSNGGTPVAVSTSKVRYKGFEFNIPTDYLFEIQTNALLITDNITWGSTLEVINGSYTTIKARKEQVKLNFEKAGYVASAPAIKNYGGVEWVTLEVSKGTAKAIVAYAQGTAAKVMGVTAYTKNNTYDYSILEKVGSIIKKSTYVGASQSIEINGFQKFAPSNAVNNLTK